MRVTCPKCEKPYDDAVRWTICPHYRLEASPDGDGRGEHGSGYCEEHDLFNCPNHASTPAICGSGNPEDGDYAGLVATVVSEDG